MNLIDILAGYTIDLLSGFILFSFFNKERLSFNEYMEANKKKVRNLTYFIVILSFAILFFFWK